MRFAGKRVLVTGGGRGIGKAIALAFAREGASLAINDAQVVIAEQTAAQARELKGNVIAIEANVADEGQVGSMVDQVIRELGGVDILVNNAGVSQPIVPLVDQATSDWDRIIGINLRGAYLCSKYAARYMVKQEAGRIVNIASIAGLTGQMMRTAYAPSKAAVINLTMVLAVELAKYNVNVNAVSPGLVLTDMVKNLVVQGKMNEDAVLRRTPLGRMSTPEDIAQATLFLASEEAKNITGVNLPVDAGWTANGWYM
jgi:3-oxoacyl-[acyl-carrier protein] reductase